MKRRMILGILLLVSVILFFSVWLWSQRRSETDSLEESKTQGSEKMENSELAESSESIERGELAENNEPTESSELAENDELTESRELEEHSGETEKKEPVAGNEHIVDSEMPNEAQSETKMESENNMEAESFYATPLTEEIKERITGISFPANGKDVQISYEDLSYLHVLYVDFHGQTQEGELICNRLVEQDLLEIFKTLYENNYQIEKIRLIDEYNGDDDASMADNNSSCFNYRVVMGTTRLSKHAYGMAVDINPVYNPYVTNRNGKHVVSPIEGVPYEDRSVDFLHKIDKEDLCYKLFIEHGFTWGGDWVNSKDYQHFEKKL